MTADAPLAEVLEGKLPEVVARCERWVRERPLPGLVAGAVTADRVLLERCFGLADVAAGAPVTPQTTFRIASVTKTMTAVALMQQWEAGKFELDDPVNDYLPLDRVGPVGTGKPGDPPVTFRHLLTHTGGVGELKSLRDLLHLCTLAFFVNPKRSPLLPLERIYRRGLPCHATPGTKYAYANHGATLLGYLLEVLSGESYHDYLRRHLFEPLGMTRSDAYLSERVAPTLAVGYARRRGRWKPKPFLRTWVRPAGGVYSSLEDVNAYAAALLANFRESPAPRVRLLRPETLRMMVAPQFSLDPRAGKIGLIFDLFELAGHRFAWHGGLTLGFSSALYLVPSEGVGLFLSTNASRGSPAYGLGREVWWRVLGVDPAEERKNLTGHPATRDVAFLSRLVGTYGPTPGFLTNLRVYAAAGEYRVELRRRGEGGGGEPHLVLRSLWGGKRHGARLWPADPGDPGAFVVVEGASRLTQTPTERVFFRLNAEDHGKAEGFVFGLRFYFRRGGVHSLRVQLVLLVLLFVAAALIAAFLELA
ncbi:MAG: hypothetical protein Kow0069_27030 [Promethearchaeota archaeon]